MKPFKSSKDRILNSLLVIGSFLMCAMVLEVILRLIEHRHIYPVVTFVTSADPTLELACYDEHLQSIPDRDLRQNNPYPMLTNEGNEDGDPTLDDLSFEEVPLAIESRYNTERFRERSFETIKRDRPVALVVGDSFCFGQGVRLRDRFSNLLEEELKGYQIVNLCIPGLGIEEVFEIFTRWLPTFPSTRKVIYAYTLNDPVANGINIGDSPNDFIYFRESNWPSRSHLIRLVLKRFGQLQMTKRTEELYHKVHTGPGMEETRKILITMDQMAKTKEIDFLIAVFPLFYRLADYPFYDIHQGMNNFCLENKIHCIDLFPLFAGEDEKKFWVHPTDFHPNHLAHKKVADYLKRKIAW